MGNGASRAARSERRPTMIYWATPHGTILRAESLNADMVGPGDGVFAAPFWNNAIVGRNLYGFIDGLDVRAFYRTVTRQIVQTGRTVHFAYRCDSAAVRREMSMQMSLDENLVRYESVLVRESERERDLPAQTLDAGTFVALCCFCQKYRFPVSSTAWKELEELFTERELPVEFRFTHSICSVCYPIVMEGFG